MNEFENTVLKLVDWIKRGVIYPKTGLPFSIADIINVTYREEVQRRL